MELFNRNVFGSPPLFNTGESITIEQPAFGGGWSFFDDMAYIRKRLADEKAEEEREQERIEEESARIAHETALSIRARADLEKIARGQAWIEQRWRERAEIEALDLDIERLQAEMNRTYREEMARRREQELLDVIFIMLTEV